MPKDTKTLCIKKGCASVLTQPHRFFCHYPDKVFQNREKVRKPEEKGPNIGT